MRRIAIDGAAAAALLTAGFAAGLVFRPGDWQLALDAWLLALGAVVLAVAVAATRGAHPRAGASPFEPRRPRKTAGGEQLPELARVEREVEMGTGTAFDVHYRLRPLLRLVAEHRLGTRRGLVLDSASGAVQDALGEDLWELVQPGRTPPRFHHDPGVSLGELRAAVEALERI